MSLLAETHNAHKARLVRLGMISPPRTPTLPPVAVPPKPVALPTMPAPKLRSPQQSTPGRSRDWLNVATPDFDSRAITVGEIQRAVCARFGITIEKLLSDRRFKALARSRHVAMYLAYEMTPLSLPSLGRLFSGRDHTTILYGIRKMVALRAADPELDAELSYLEVAIRSGDPVKPKGR
jgi:hypothetical protein